MAPKWLTILTLVGCAWMFSPRAALAQTTIRADTSAQFINFYTGSTPGNLNVIMGWTPGENTAGNRTLTGTLGTGTSWGGNPSYSLTTFDPFALTGNGSGTFTAQSSALANSVFSVSSGGSNVFQGALSALSFNQTAGSSAVTMQATINGTGAFKSVYNLLGTIMLAPGASLVELANGSGQNEAGVIVPEPATVMLFGTGLLFLLGLGVTRRREQMI